MTIHVFGIRHHGPGCARALVEALEELQPAVVVMEGPADAEGIVQNAAAEGMHPPVAMLVYPVDEPSAAVYYPLAIFSPELQAIRWTDANEVPLRLMDLPTSLLREIEVAEHERLLEEMRAKLEAAESDAEGSPASDTEHESERAGEASSGSAPGAEKPGEPGDPAQAAIIESPEARLRSDPLAMLSQAAGYDDPELWWEQQIERRRDTGGLFAGITLAMTTLRREHPEERTETLLREAYMRQTLRKVLAELKADGRAEADIAVVCGAWHAPALTEAALAGKSKDLPEETTKKADTAALKGRRPKKTAATWIPWTSDRLAFRSGYGAGITSPGWYAHLWETPDEAATRWIVEAARLLRGEDLDASSASVIEAIRLSDAMAALRDLQAPGLPELSASIQTVLCHGRELPMELIRDRLEVGHLIGEVPPETPTVPLQQDLARRQKTLRMKPAANKTTVDLDLRTDNGRDRSHLLHRLQLLGVEWGQVVGTGSSQSTFRESWQLQWLPELSVRLIEANIYGSTVEEAALGFVMKTARERVRHRPEAGTSPPSTDETDAERLARLAELLDQSLLAGLSRAIDPLLLEIDRAAADSPGVRSLLDAVPPLARVCRYGDVRGTRAADVEPIVEGLLERALVGLPAAAMGLDVDASERLLASLEAAGQAVTLLARDDLDERWKTALRKTANARRIHPVVEGRLLRLLLDLGALEDDELTRRTRLALAPANDPEDVSAWASGFLRGSGLALLHRRAVWAAFDTWLKSLPDETFEQVLPMVRRAFSDFSRSEREKIGRVVRDLAADPTQPADKSSDEPLDHDRAALLLPTLRAIYASGSSP